MWTFIGWRGQSTRLAGALLAVALLCLASECEDPRRPVVLPAEDATAPQVGVSVQEGTQNMSRRTQQFSPGSPGPGRSLPPRPIQKAEFAGSQLR